MGQLRSAGILLCLLRIGRRRFYRIWIPRTSSAYFPGMKTVTRSTLPRPRHGCGWHFVDGVFACVFVQMVCRFFVNNMSCAYNHIAGETPHEKH